MGKNVGKCILSNSSQTVSLQKHSKSNLCTQQITKLNGSGLKYALLSHYYECNFTNNMQIPGKRWQLCEMGLKPQWVVREDAPGNPEKSCQAPQRNYRSSIFNIPSIFSIDTDRKVLTLQLFSQLASKLRKSNLSAPNG